MSGYGYGDQLSPAELVEQEELLRAFYRASVHHVAKTAQPNDERFDDLVQEGVLAAWKATQEPRTDPATYGAVSARRRVGDMLTGRYPMTGSEAEPGKRIHDMSRSAAHHAEGLEAVEDMASSGNPYVAVEQRVDMARALARLEPRDQTIARMVGEDQPWEVIAPVVGMKPLGARNRWTREVRPQLRDILAA